MVSEAVGPLLKRLGFKKERLTWRREEAESILVINFQHSQWSDLYYINLGVFFRALDSKDNPGSHQCHLQARLDAIARDPELLLAASDFASHSVGPVDRATILQSEVFECAVPWLRKRATLQDAREALIQGTAGTMVFATLREHLQLT
jgi:hypothetical protein